MSRFDYEASKDFGSDPPFYALIMAACGLTDREEKSSCRCPPMPDVTPDWKSQTEGGIGRKKPLRGWRRRGRRMATREQWAELRAAKVRECRICETLAGPMELHHLVPRGMGGDDVADNLVPLCRACHECVTRNEPNDLQDLAEALTDAEYAYIVGKLGEGGIGRLFGV